MKDLDIAKFLAITTTLMVMAMVGLGYFFTPMDSNIQSQVLIAWAGVVGFYFGSSQGSKDKTALMAKADVDKPVE